MGRRSTRRGTERRLTVALEGSFGCDVYLYVPDEKTRDVTRGKVKSAYSWATPEDVETLQGDE